MSMERDLLDFIDGDKRRLEADLTQIDTHIQRSTNLFLKAPPSADGTLNIPYKVDAREEHLSHAVNLSHATNLMVSHALFSVSHTTQPPNLLLTPPPQTQLRVLNAKEWTEWLATVRERATLLASRPLTEAADKAITHSETYGNNSPYVTCWHHEVAGFCSKPRNKALELKIDTDADPLYTNPSSSVGGPPPTRDVDFTRAMYCLRALQSECLLDDNSMDKRRIKRYSERFLSALHDHLSFYQIPDSRFDPAELAFTLEGALLCETRGGPKLERATLSKALDVLVACRTQTSNWRPARPIVFKDKGLVLFPVSVEVANSILRSLSLCREDVPRDSMASTLSALRSYMKWLDTRTVELDKDKTQAGWHSEHVNNVDLIHPWESSQVMVFMAHLRAALQSHLSSELLRLAGFAWKPPHALLEYAPPAWDKELTISFASRLNHPSEIERLFITPRKSAPSQQDDLLKWSLLLYGPPGTGKTTTAKKLAVALDRPLISLSVSDFIASGEADVERRAKAVFDVLMEQRHAVVLFDEIDHLLLDRNSHIYNELDTVFQFLTPGMLTKLQDLRSSRGVLFIIATNYEHRIDSAIKRHGRIDCAQLVLPPDSHKRKAVISLTKKTFCIAEDEMPNLAKASLFLSESDIHYVVKQATSYGDCLTMLKMAPRAMSLASYESSLPTFSGAALVGQSTLRELIGVMALFVETVDAPEVFAEITKAKPAISKISNIFQNCKEGLLQEIGDFDLVIQDKFKTVLDALGR